ncbi:flagellar biosynthetic protein FliO [Salipaludibacillus sp. CF4.18]|uniref:flagellar biosynthetic protein FliO n=1 Tax=Salipaludibacillus sp. CF4.18 TaxID=3373081 RepID=UPI003EE5B740
MRNLCNLYVFSFVIILCFSSTFVVNAETNNFGEGDRRINEILQTPSNSEEENTDSGINEENDTESDNVQMPALEGNEDTGMGEQNLFFLTLQLFLALGVVILGIYVVLRFINKRSQNVQGNSLVRNIGGVGVGTNRSVQVVHIGSRVLIVGVGETVQLLKEIDDPDELEVILKSNQSQELFEQPLTKFTGWLKKKKLNGFSNSSAAGSSNSDATAFQNLLKQELTDVKKSHKKVHSALEEKDR